MKDVMDSILQEYLSEPDRQAGFDSAVAEVFCALITHCPEAITGGGELTMRSAVAKLRRCGAISRSVLAELIQVDDAELGQWELGVKDSHSVRTRLGDLLQHVVLAVDTHVKALEQRRTATRPSNAFARSHADEVDRDPLMAAINRAKARAQSGGKGRSLDSRKCNWYRHIAHEAENTLLAFHATIGEAVPTIPVPVDLIAELGLGVDYFLDHMGSGDSGWYDPDKRRICINADEPETRRRYTFAHEIGHAVMHASKLRGRVHRDSLASIDEARVELTSDVLASLSMADIIAARGEERELQQRANRETEANVFAAVLVIPTKPLCKFVQDGLIDPSSLAAKFGVSVPAMEWRLRFLDACMGMPEAKPESKGQGTLDF